MKITNRFFAVLVSVLTLLTAGCGPGEGNEPTPAEIQLQKLAGDFKASSNKTWQVSEVIFDTNDIRTADWAGFTISLSTTGGISGTHSYSTQNGVSGGPWPASGSWEFGGTVDNPNINKIIRDDGLEIAITVNDNLLTMIFVFDNNVHTSGRVDAVNGEYAFTFSSN